MLRENHWDKVLVSNLRERGPDGHRGTWGGTWSVPSTSFQRALATLRLSAADLSSRNECVLLVSVLPETRVHYTLQEPRIIKQTW